MLIKDTYDYLVSRIAPLFPVPLADTPDWKAVSEFSHSPRYPRCSSPATRSSCRRSRTRFPPDKPKTPCIALHFSLPFRERLANRPGTDFLVDLAVWLAGWLQGHCVESPIRADPPASNLATRVLDSSRCVSLFLNQHKAFC